nr:MAG: replication associated protein [Cressdnaviricota sp.]
MPEDSAISSNTVGNTKRSYSAKHWFFTLHNSDEISHEELYKKLLQLNCSEFVFQEECGEETLKHHYQGTFSLIEKKDNIYIKKRLYNHIHLEKSMSALAKDYCSKTETRINGPWWYPKPVDTISNLRPWQSELLIGVLLQVPDDRTIHWYWDFYGKTGKTVFAKYCCVHHKAAYVKGKKNDILYAATILNAPIYIIDLSRTMSDHVPYEAIEDLKNGIFFSGKYESAMVIRNCPHIVVFANFPPDLKKLSEDRWNVVNITVPPQPPEGGLHKH